ncbi:MAG: peptidoglycan DD-metalloendopeptidase family protein [Bacteroidales bacterium]|jgi:murein DD-endopeptidase MepM/ murein hydrolase activator NlpD|nr:peptidoglycan DD-metalloendopeptidase family protein [Bacteroidales bacterium]
MKLVLKIATSVLFLFVLKVSYGQTLMDSLSSQMILQEMEISIEDDEVSIDSLISLLNVGNIDSTTVPAAKLYGYVWNNQLVNPYQKRMVDMTDTVCIDFSQYCHPNRNVVTSDFGFRRGWRFHYGIDTRLKVGDSICSSFDGMVRISKRGKAYGNYIVIRHFNGLETVYAHLSKTMVQVNQVVRAGEIIGLGGNTGRSTGPHLHYEIRYLGQPIAPRDLIDWQTYSAKFNMAALDAQHFAYVKEIEKIRYYVVRKGDTLSGISLKTGVSISKICQLNNIKKTSILRIGQRLRFS